jgi:hypothetical protein
MAINYAKLFNHASRRSRSRFRVRPRFATRPVVTLGKWMTGRDSIVS